MSNPLFSALESVFEEEGAGPALAHQPLTLRTLLRLLDAGSFPGRSELPGLVQQLRDRIGVEIRQVRADLKSERDEELEGYLHEILAVYLELELSLQAVRVALLESDPGFPPAGGRKGGYPGLLQPEADELRALLERLQCWDGAIQEWNARDVLRCPRCGRAHEAMCAVCHLETLYHDREAIARPGGKAQLGPEYTAVGQAWSAVVSGEVTLSAIWAPLEALEQTLRRQLRMAQHELKLGMVGERVQRTLKRIVLAAQQSLTGAEQMRRTQSTRRMLDLNEGWDTIFDYALEIQESVPELARALGRPTAAAAITVEDSLLIDFD